jgi:hypothetical protein
MKKHLRSLFKPALATLFMALAPAACLQRPLGTDQPKTTNVIVENLTQSSVDKIDMLFVVDNSLSMADKQEILALALPDLVRRLVDPVCIDANGGTSWSANGTCPAGTAREFQPITNIHIAVVTSSLGGFGAEVDCISDAEGEKDNSHLLGSLPRVEAIIPGTPDFLTWCPETSQSATSGACAPSPETGGGAGDAMGFSDAFANQVREAGEFGCGWEATLEAWYRFLIEPAPWTSIVRVNCNFGNDTNMSCVAPSLDASGAMDLDETIIAQRKAFLRPDSLVAIVMLTDENDCSFKASGQSWRLSQARSAPDMDYPNGQPNRAFKGSSTCATDPNNQCCHSCGAKAPANCPTEVNAAGMTVGQGCMEPRYPAMDDLGDEAPTDDAVNLRCFNHKQRFGVDYLYPVARYSNALLLTDLCPASEDLSPTAADGTQNPNCGPDRLVKNPLYIDYTYPDRLAADPAAMQVVPRNRDLVFLAGIVGVPWQDIAVDPNAETLVYRTNRVNPDPDAPPVIDWVQLLGNATLKAPYDLLTAPPTDPLMHEQIAPRTGTNTAINGGEWDILDRDDLQYACIFPKETPVMCPQTIEETTSTTPNCDCTFYGADGYNNPLCNGFEQTHAKAYPSIRPLQVLRDYGPNSIVASICPKETENENADDFGYRPAVAAIVERLKEQLQDKCLPRRLEVKGGDVNCLIVEANPATGANCSGAARTDVPAGIATKVIERLESTDICEGEACNAYHLCQITPLAADQRQSCLMSEDASGDGWCYIDPEQGLGNPDLVEKCAPTEQRKIRFVGGGLPQKGTVTFFACTGAPEGATVVAEDPAAAEEMMMMQ